MLGPHLCSLAQARVGAHTHAAHVPPSHSHIQSFAVTLAHAHADSHHTNKRPRTLRKHASALSLIHPSTRRGTSGKPLYFRGRRIIDATIDYLAEHHGLLDAENVLLTGCSAGGLATYLHTDYVGDTLKAKSSTLKKYKAASISGFFLLHNTTEGKAVYPTEMKEIFTLANSTHGVNKDCIAAKAPADQWECNFAEEAYVALGARAAPAATTSPGPSLSFPPHDRKSCARVFV